MVDAVYRGNIEELLSVINYLKKYIIVFVIVLLVLLSVFHFSRYSVQVVPLITVTLVLLPAVYYTTVLVLKLGTCVFASYRTAEVSAMNAEGNRGHDALKTPERPYPNSPTPPPSYEEATRNDVPYHQHYQPSPWLPSTSSGYTSGGVVFNVEHQYRHGAGDAAIWAPPPLQTQTQPLPPQAQQPTPPLILQPLPQPATQPVTQPATQPATQPLILQPPPPQPATQPSEPLPPKTATRTFKNVIPSVTITMDNDHNGSMEI